jgi:hypothetical protein
MKTCPTCGQSMPPDLPTDKLSRMQRRVYELVVHAGSRGINSDALFERLYADDPEGGPLTGKHSMYAIVRQVNLTFIRYNIPYRIHAPGSGNGTTGNYRLERL